MLESMPNLQINLDGQDVAVITFDGERSILIPVNGVGAEVKDAVSRIFSEIDSLESGSRVDRLIQAYENCGFNVVRDGKEVSYHPVEVKEAGPEQLREARFIYESNLIEDVTDIPFKDIRDSLVNNVFGGHVSAWRFARTLAHDKTHLTLEHVKQMQKWITDEQSRFPLHFLDPKYRGNLRDIPVSIGGNTMGVPDESHCCSFFERMNLGMNDLRPDNLEKILKFAARIHLEYEQAPGMHPFADGNGRSGRLIVNYILAYFDYPPIVLSAKDRQNYYHAFFVEEDEGSIAMENYFIKQYGLSANLLMPISPNTTLPPSNH